MLINRRNGLMAGKRLPYDAEVEYLQFTGAQYIDSRATVSDPSMIEVGIDSDTPIPYGFTHQSSHTGTWVSAYYASNTYIVNYKNYDNRWTSTQEPTTRALRVYDGGSGIYRDGTLQKAFTASVGTDSIANIPWPIGCVWDFNSSGYDFRYPTTGTKVYRVYIKISGVLVRDYIPVRKGTVGYMYDRVSGKLFGSDGTGDFVLGPDVVPVEYIESHGTEWIDTGVYLTSNHSVEIDFQLTAISQWRKGLFGGLSTGARYGALLSPADSSLEFGYGSSNVFYQTTPDALRHSAKQQKNLFYLDGVLIHTFNEAAFTSSFSAPLGNFNYTNYAPAQAKYYMSKWYDGDALIRSFRPVRVGSGSTWEGAMMDVLTRRIYRNQGTGAFSYGNDLKYPIPAE